MRFASRCCADLQREPKRIVLSLDAVHALSCGDLVEDEGPAPNQSIEADSGGFWRRLGERQNQVQGPRAGRRVVERLRSGSERSISAGARARCFGASPQC